MLALLDTPIVALAVAVGSAAAPVAHRTIASAEAVALVRFRAPDGASRTADGISGGVAVIAVTIPSIVGLGPLGRHMLSFVKLTTYGPAHDTELLLGVEVGELVRTVKHLAEGADNSLIRRVEAGETVGAAHHALRCLHAARSRAQRIDMVVVGSLLAAKIANTVAPAKFGSRHGRLLLGSRYMWSLRHNCTSLHFGNSSTQVVVGSKQPFDRRVSERDRQHLADGIDSTRKGIVGLARSAIR
jgi:hypothetical protein